MCIRDSLHCSPHSHTNFALSRSQQPEADVPLIRQSRFIQKPLESVKPVSINIMPGTRMKDDFPSVRGKEKSSGISRACEARVSNSQQFPADRADHLMVKASAFVLT